jgi:multiple sugar transport system permease protein
MFILPRAIPTIVTAFIWRGMFSPRYGLINTTISGVWSLVSGSPRQFRFDWFGDPSFAMIGVIIVAVWKGFPFVFLVLLAGLQALPTELSDAAKIDGASLFDIFLRIIVPLSKPALATVAIFSFFTHWNSFQEPLIYLNTMEKYTVPLGLRFYLSAMGNAHWNWLMAATLVAMVLPLTVFFVAQR